MLRLLMVLALLSAGSGDDHGRLEASLLSLLGLGKRPRPGNRANILVPPAMLDLYRRQTGLQVGSASLPLPGRHTRSANTVRSFTHQESDIDSRFTRSDRFRLMFDLENLPAGEKITGAELRVSVAPGESRVGRQRVLVHDIVRPGRKGHSGPLLRLLDSRMTEGGSEGHVVSLDVLPAAERWAVEPDQNHGLLVRVTAEDGSKSKSGDTHVRLRRSSGVEGVDEHQPLLFVYLDDGKNNPSRSFPSGVETSSDRRKRATGTTVGRKHRRKDGRDTCKRHPLYVDFADVGWNDWIVAPPGYDAYYCHGDCPFPLADHLNSTNHAIVQTLVNSVNPSAVPKACCVPTALSSISMLYVDEEDKVVLKNYQDMAVMGCGCR